MGLVAPFENSESIVALLGADDGRFRELNHAFERLTGYRREDAIGRKPIEVGLWSDLEFRAQLWESLRIQRRIVDARTEVTCADGSRLDGRLHVELLRGSESLLFCLLQILPEQHRSEEEQRRESLYRDLFLSASEGIYRSLPNGGFLDVNPAKATMLGYASPAHLLAESGRARG